MRQTHSWERSTHSASPVMLKMFQRITSEDKWQRHKWVWTREREKGSRRRATDSHRCDQTIGQTFMLIDSILLESSRPERLNDGEEDGALPCHLQHSRCLHSILPWMETGQRGLQPNESDALSHNGKRKYTFSCLEAIQSRLYCQT